MENTQSTPKAPKIKLDFKDSKYATGRRKTSVARVWLKRVQEKFMLMVNFLVIILLVITIKCRLRDLLS